MCDRTNISYSLNHIRLSTECLDIDGSCNIEDPKVSSVSNNIRDEPCIVIKGNMISDETKSTPKNVFPYVSCLPLDNNIVLCFILSVWDNIVGPQTVYVWKKQSSGCQETLDERILPEKNRRTKKCTKKSSVCLDVITDSKKSILVNSIAEKNIDLPTSISSETDNNFSSEIQNSCKEKRPSKNCIFESDGLPGAQCLVDGIDTSDPLEFSRTTDHETYIITNSLNNRHPLLPIEVTDEGRLTPTLQNINKNLHYDDALNYHRPVSTETCKAPTKNMIETKRTNVAATEYIKQETNSSHFVSEYPKGSKGTESVDFKHEDIHQTGCVKNCSHLYLATIVQYVTEHSVGMELGTKEPCKVSTSLLVVPHHGIILLTARFFVLEEAVGVPYCLSMIVPLEEMDYFLPLVNFTTETLIRAAVTTRLLITKSGLAGGGDVCNQLVDLCHVLVSLRKASLDQYPLSLAGRPPEDRQLTELLLTSHLQTLGSTLVIADSPNAVNKVVMWLAQFSRPEDLHISRLCLSFSQWPYHSGLAIQGVVRNSNGEVNLTSQQLLSSRPLTVVDLARGGTVKQTITKMDGHTNNTTTLRQELLALWNDLPYITAPSQSLLNNVKKAAPLVKRFLHDYDRLASCGTHVKQNFVAAFLRSLQYTALALISWTQHEWGSSPKHHGYMSLRQILMSVFLLDDGDLKVVLAQAEVLSPGFCAYVYS